jgi:hypothetical protein
LLLPALLWVAAPMPGTATIAALVGLALLSTALAYVLYFRLLAVAGPVNLLLVTLVIPAFAILLGAVVLGERLGPQHLVGMAMIAAGLALIDGRWLRRSECERGSAPLTLTPPGILIPGPFYRARRWAAIGSTTLPSVQAFTRRRSSATPP